MDNSSVTARDTQVAKEISDLTKVFSEGQHATRTRQRAAASRALVSKVPILVLPESATNAQRLKILCMMTTCGRSTSKEGTSWRSWVLSYVVMAFPELKEIFEKKNFPEYEVHAITIEKCIAWCAVFDRVNESEEAGYEEAIALPDEFPTEGVPAITQALTDACEATTPYCFVAILLFLCGKTISALNRVAVTVNRPRALIAEFSAQRAEFVLNGDGRISDNGHTMVNSAWNAVVEPRISIIEHFADMSNAPGSTAERIIAHIMQLLKNAGMNYVHHIVRLLTDMPWTASMNGLRADYIAFKESVHRSTEIPATFRAYYKLAYGNQCTIFRRADMPALTSIAIIYGAQFQETMQKYTIERGYSTIVDMWVARANENGLSITRASDQAIATSAAF